LGPLRRSQAGIGSNCQFDKELISGCEIMQIYLLRHGQTEYNAQHRYQGQQDIPLSAAGRAQLRPAGFMPDFAKLVEESLAQHKQQLVIVAHGGIQMAVMSRYGLPRRDYHDWCGPNAGGYRLDAANWQTDHTLQLLETVQYTKATQSEAAL